MRDWSGSEIAILRSMAAGGYTGEEIGHVLGRTGSQVRNKASRIAVPLFGRASPYTDDAVAAVRDGLTYGQAAKGLGISRSAVAGAVYRARRAEARP